MTGDGYVGLKTGVKSAVVTALRDGLTNDFWRSVDESLKDLTTDEMVLPEFPEKEWRLPLVTVTTSFGRVTWDTLNPYSFGPQLKLKQVALTSVTVTLDIYARSAIHRDRLCDIISSMLLFAYTNPKNSAFAARLKDFNHDLGIDPALGTMSIGSDNVGTGIPWAADRYVYTTSISFDMSVRWTMNPTEHVPGIKKIDVSADGQGELRSTSEALQRLVEESERNAEGGDVQK